MMTLPTTPTITLTRDQIRALDCAVKYPSQATVRLILNRERHKLDDVYVLINAGLVAWLPNDNYNFMATDAGRAYHRRYHAIEKLKSAGWQVEATHLANWFIVTTPGKQAGMLEYDSLDAAWDTVLASAAVQS